MSQYYCPNCNADLGRQKGFRSYYSYWECRKCGAMLTDPNDDDFDGDNYPGVVWKCDKCGACLNKQSGFSDYYDTWDCERCGYTNDINEDEIYSSEQEWRDSQDDDDDDDDDWDDDDDDDDWDDDDDDDWDDDDDDDWDYYAEGEYQSPVDTRIADTYFLNRHTDSEFYCVRCDKLNKLNSKFCAKCGSNLADVFPAGSSTPQIVDARKQYMLRNFSSSLVKYNNGSPDGIESVFMIPYLRALTSDSLTWKMSMDIIGTSIIATFDEIKRSSTNSIQKNNMYRLIIDSVCLVSETSVNFTLSNYQVASPEARRAVPTLIVAPALHLHIYLLNVLPAYGIHATLTELVLTKIHALFELMKNFYNDDLNTEKQYLSNSEQKIKNYILEERKKDEQIRLERERQQKLYEEKAKKSRIAKFWASNPELKEKLELESKELQAKIEIEEGEIQKLNIAYSLKATPIVDAQNKIESLRSQKQRMSFWSIKDKKDIDITIANAIQEKNNIKEQLKPALEIITQKIKNHINNINIYKQRINNIKEEFTKDRI